MELARGSTDLEKRVVLASLLFAGAMLGLIGFAAVRLGVSVPGCVTSVKPFTQGALIEVAPGRFEAHVVAKNWAFKPDHLKVPKGAIVDFYLTSTDVVHGFHVEGTEVNLMAIPGVVNYAQARFDAPGKHQFLCHEFCGSGHQEMSGELEVTP
jgi:cytochrome c oxidase subunit II